ncbi:MAG: hypothetical protein ACM3SY_14085 [Candidatus Omnitrophota bacterium]
MSPTDNANQKRSKPKPPIATFEDAVVTSAAVVGIIGGGIMSFFIKSLPIVVAIFMGMGISSLVYRFLGGIAADNSLTLKGIKLTGTVAVWIASALIINTQLVKQYNIKNAGDDWKQRNLILTVRNPNGHLMRGVELTVADEIIPPVQNDRSKYAIPLKKLIEVDNKIFIDQKSDRGETNSMWMVYDPQKFSIDLFIENK